MNVRFFAIASALVVTAGCHTMQGVGEDLYAGGQKVDSVFKKKPANDTNTTLTTTPGTYSSPSDTQRLHPSPDSWAAAPSSNTRTQ
jgi:predicted small secreted protein